MVVRTLETPPMPGSTVQVLLPQIAPAQLLRALLL